MLLINIISADSHRDKKMRNANKASDAQQTTYAWLKTNTCVSVITDISARRAEIHSQINEIPAGAQCSYVASAMGDPDALASLT